MNAFLATEAKDEWGVITDAALHSPVSIAERGRPAWALTPIRDDQELLIFNLGKCQYALRHTGAAGSGIRFIVI